MIATDNHAMDKIFSRERESVWRWAGLGWAGAGLGATPHPPVCMWDSARVCVVQYAQSKS